jgi:hypothetical protein
MKARFGQPSASGSTNVPRSNARGYSGACRAEARCARLRRQPRRGHVAWERRQSHRGCAADPRASRDGARACRPQVAPCVSRPHARRGPDHATPGARRAAPRCYRRTGPRRATCAPRRGIVRRAGPRQTTLGYCALRRGHQVAASSTGATSRANGEVGSKGHGRGERE